MIAARLGAHWLGGVTNQRWMGVSLNKSMTSLELEETYYNPGYEIYESQNEARSRVRLSPQAVVWNYITYFLCACS